MSSALKCTSLFASASCISFNRCSTLPCHFKSQRDACLTLQERHSVYVGRSRESLNILQFGNIRWARRGGTGDKWDLKELDPVPSDTDLLNDEVAWPNGYSTYYSFGRA